MLSEMELEILTTDMIDKEQKEMLQLRQKGGVLHGRETESPEVLGTLDERSRIDRLSCKDILQD